MLREEHQPVRWKELEGRIAHAIGMPDPPKVRIHMWRVVLGDPEREARLQLQFFRQFSDLRLREVGHHAFRQHQHAV
ncbi:MAG: hypothetical protein IPH71_12490 [Proteobacteria bacterium]|nr:hypothetical protein [Pseudomonadota bacterium]